MNKAAPGRVKGRRARALIRSHFRSASMLLRRLARDTDPQSVHQARVAIRRLRTLVSAVGPALDKRPRQRLQDQFKRVADELGAVRDADIRAEILLPLLDGTGPLAARIRAASRGVRRRFKTSSPEDSLLRRLNEVARLVRGESLFQPGVDADSLLSLAVRRRCEKMTAALRKKLNSPSRRHALRIQVKKCRYLLDACGSTNSGEGARERLRELQDCLGELNDLAQTQSWLKQQVSESALSRRLARQLRSRKQGSLTRLRRLRRELLKRGVRAG